MMEISLVNLLVGAFKKMIKLSNFYVKAIKFATKTTSTCFIEAYRCSTRDTFYSKTVNLEGQLVTCTERVKHVYPKNVYELGGILFHNLHAFEIPYNKAKFV